MPLQLRKMFLVGVGLLLSMVLSGQKNRGLERQGKGKPFGY